MIELAVVLFIIGLVLGSILVPLATQVEQRKISDTRRALEEIREALTGFAIINGRLPCPDTDTDPTNVNYGLENSPCSAAPTAEGYLPWKTLGVTEMDAWGIKRTAVGSPRIGDWRYRVDRDFAVTFTLTTGFGADSLTVRDSAGTALTSTERPIAIVFSAGPNTVPDGQNAIFEATNAFYQADVPSPTFDDILIWISRPILFNRLVSAGKLP
jgi:type II secretory pathway pseudopilin PulG